MEKGKSDKLTKYISQIEICLNKKSKKNFLKLQERYSKTLCTNKLKKITKKYKFTQFLLELEELSAGILSILTKKDEKILNFIKSFQYIGLGEKFKIIVFGLRQNHT